MKLSVDDNELLQELMEHDEGIKVLYKAMKQLIEPFEDDLVNHPYQPGSEAALGYKKAKLDGARKLLGEIKQLLKIK